MKVSKKIKEAMSVLHIDTLRRNQLAPINRIVNGKDTMVIAPTSFGKSLLYTIPSIIHKDKLTIVIEPLLALMHNQVQSLKKYGIAAAYLDSTLSCDEHDAVLSNLKKNQIHMLYIAPEQLSERILSWATRFSQVGLVVVDECHCVTTWGDSFREAYQTIGTYIDTITPHPVVVALSATVFPEDRTRIMKRLSMDHVKCFEISLYRSNLCFMKKNTPSHKEQQKSLKRYLRKYHRHTTMVFCATKSIVKAVGNYLEELYPNEVAIYHGDDKRSEPDLLSGKKHIIVATSALSMGVNVPNVDLVINFNMPMSLADYSQMAGRAGREGQKSRSILLYNSTDYYKNYALLQSIPEREIRVQALERLDAMKAFCEDTEHCMVTTMLQALGDSHHKKCRYCTNCQKER